MTPVSIRGFGAICAAGYDAPSVLGSIVSNVQLFDDLDERGPTGEPITAAAVPLPRSLKGDDRLCALALLALEEASAGVEDGMSIPLVLCAPEEAESRGAHLLDRLSSASTRPLDRKRSVVVARGRSGAMMGLQTASQWLGRSQVPACLLVGVDSLLSPRRISALVDKQEILHDGREEGYVPGEGAAALLLTRHPDPAARAAIMGFGAAREEAATDPRRPLVGEGLALAAARALQLAGFDPRQVDAICHESTGLQTHFEEFLLARGRTPLDRCREARVFNAGLAAGEIGAAAGALSVVMMAFLLEKAVISGPAIALLRGQEAERGAVVVGPVARPRRS